MGLDSLIERYNSALKAQEESTIRLINRVLDESFAGVLKRAQGAIERGSPSASAYELALGRELGQLVPAVAPGEADRYENAFQRLLREAVKIGADFGNALLRQAGAGRPEGPGVSTGFILPIEAAVGGARESRRYLERHGAEFAERGAEVVARGVLEGRSNAEIARQLRERLGVVKSRAETIAQTESMRAYGTARDARFRAAGVEQVRWWATSDDRTCPLCRPRAGLLYPLGQAQTPLHPRCRCTTTPWNRDVAEMEPRYVEAVERHRAQVLGAEPAAALNRGRILGANL